MKPQGFRRIALSLPEAVEIGHMGHPDFRVRGKIFATLGYPDKDWAMVKLTPMQQALFTGKDPAIFKPVKGAWGRRGCTIVQLDSVDRATLRRALVAAWRNIAPKELADEAAALD
jgi:hypothetical protein